MSQAPECGAKTFRRRCDVFDYLTAGASDAGVRDAYGRNYERLAELKSRYDPTNFFSSNRNIEPEHL
jgi:FAD/FMN-containing dehydrogenase